MRPLDELNSYLRKLEARLRLAACSRGAAMLAVLALALTLVLVWIANRLAFSSGSLAGSRFFLFVALALMLAFGLALPLLRLNRRKAARRAEQDVPDFEQRLLTFAEREPGASPDPFFELLAADTVEVAQRNAPASVVPRAGIMAFCAAAIAGAGILLWLILAGPGYLGYGAAMLWAGAPRDNRGPLYEIVVGPGDQTVRRRTDQLITAHLQGFQTPRVQLWARYHSASKWDVVAMQPQSSGTGFEFLLPGLPDGVEYYVEAGAVRSPHYNIQVVDLPVVKSIRVTYRFPAWTGLQNVVEEEGGDLRAVEGTDAVLEIRTDKPLEGGMLAVDAGKQIQLEDRGDNLYQGILRVEKDGLYHIGALDRGRPVRLTQDYFIEARKETPPEIRITRPGRDYKSSPIEEVTVQVTAADDYGLQEVALKYSVNGGPERTVSLLPRKGAKEAEGRSVISLEDFKLVPGDLVSLYATARDARVSTKTDIYFIEAQPFEKEYSQAQQAGGGGGGGDQDQNQISARQKEMIAATWNELKNFNSNSTERAETARFLADVQGKLRDQARSLARRMQSRELSQQNQEFSSFTKDMNAAAEAMGAAVDQLKAQRWQDALAPEQKALQHLLRAEATFRQIQVAFGSRGGGGGGGGAGRDLESLFDLELDTEKNQYETGQQSAGQDQRSREIDEALQRLEQLARRQQELAQQRDKAQSFQQRWQQEMLRREAEQLQRRMEQLTRGGQSGQQSSSQQASSQQGQGQSSGQSSQSGSQPSGRPQRAMPARGSAGGVDPRVEQALERLRQATEDMRRATSGQTGGQPGEAEARRAAERLNEARNLLGGLRRQESSDQLSGIADSAERLAEQQRGLSSRLRQLYGNQPSSASPSLRQPGVSRQESEQLASERKQMADDLAALERRMQEAVRDLAATQREAASKLRDALGQMQQDELGLRLKYSADWIRRGLGAYAYLREAPVTEGLNRLAGQVRQAQQALDKNAAPGRQAGLESALERVERLRSQMEQMARNQAGRDQRGSRPGDQPGSQGQSGQNAPGQQGQQGQPGQPGMQPDPSGRGGMAGRSSARGETRFGTRESLHGGGEGGADYPAMNRGDYMPPAPDHLPQGGAGDFERAYREGLRDLSQLRMNLQDSPEIAREVQALIREMQRLDPSRFKGNPELVERLRGGVLANLEQIELQLRRKLDEKNAGQVRSAAPSIVPPGYRDSVAEYFRRLSKSQ